MEIAMNFQQNRKKDEKKDTVIVNEKMVKYFTMMYDQEKKFCLR